MDEEFQEFLEIFQEESLERLVNVSRALDSIAGSAGTSAPLLDEVDRELHTIKGSSRLLGFMQLATLVHSVEGLARAYRERPAMGLDLLVEASDRLSALVEEASAKGEDVDDVALQARVEAAARGESAQPERAAPSMPSADAPSKVPEPTVDSRRLEPSETPSSKIEAPAETQDSPTTTILRDGSGKFGPEDETVRVRSSRLTHLDEIVSDFSLAKQRLERYEIRLRDLTRNVDAGSVDAKVVSQILARIVQDYRSDLLHVDTTTSSLERLAVDVRLRPVSFLFDAVPREARSLARRLGKQVRVRVSGEDTEMDRVILEALRSPLTHLIRNSLDHGLETPSERIAAGKPPDGLLAVSAGQEGSQVAIHLEDDGRGIDADTIRRLAVERGILDASAARKIRDDEAVQLVFAPGFSTKETASQISGRGVGMDAVRRAVEDLKGEVRVRSTRGEGTRVTIRLPLTLLISRVTLLRSGSQQLALPTESVLESLRLRPERVAKLGERPSIKVGDDTVPFVRLASLLGHPLLPDPVHLRVLLIAHAGERLALAVDELLEERSVVVRPLGWPLELLPGISGAIHMPDGEIALQLHVPELFAQVRTEPSAARPQVAHDAERCVLVVDDSIVSRQLIARTLSRLGLDPLLAVDGIDAWSVLQRIQPQLIVTDVEMPRLDGLGLVRRIRRDERLGGIPIIIFSNRGAVQDRQAGLEAGADAYIAKTEFNQESFRQVIERML